GLGSLNASLLPIVDAINMIQPRTTILTHFADDDLETFISEYSILVSNTDCEILNIPYFSTRIFETDGNDT
ncbi:MAG: hypothetical protein KGD60_15600, partial [Candidatus Thorarchaeota archaeon]|nr:hypothetical protein [Candidatus Thorarchaeota archaeon]